MGPVCNIQFQVNISRLRHHRVGWLPSKKVATGPALFPRGKRLIHCQSQGNGDFPRLVLGYSAQGNPQIDEGFAEKGSFRTGTG